MSPAERAAAERLDEAAMAARAAGCGDKALLLITSVLRWPGTRSVETVLDDATRYVRKAIADHQVTA